MTSHSNTQPSPLLETFERFFRIKSAADVEGTMGFFSSGLVTYTDATLGWGLDGFEARAIGTLSGGQMQRGLFARLLLQDARLILLDEPFAALDANTIADLSDLIARWHGEGRTILTVLHDLELVRGRFPETLLLAREAVAWGKTPEVLTRDNLAKARAMCEVFHADAPVCEAAA